MSLFKFDSEFMETVRKAIDYVVLNLLCLICCIPIITIGAATAAKYYVSMKLIREGSSSVVRPFFTAFKENFKQATVVWLICAFLIVMIMLDWYLLFMFSAQTWVSIVQGFLFVMSLFILSVITCIFPLQARFQMTTIELFKFALAFSIKYFLRVILAAIFAVMPCILGLLFLEWLPLVWGTFASVELFLNSSMYTKKFKALEEAISEKQHK